MHPVALQFQRTDSSALHALPSAQDMPRRAARVSLQWPGIAVAVLFCVFVAAAVRLAWVGDDAYITLRTVENWVTGHGLRWNAVDRVQTYTHPLWLFVLTAGRLVSGESYFTTIAISIALASAAVVLLLRMGGSAGAAIAGLVALLGARSFLDYSSSGLENPLTYLLLALYVRELGGGGAVSPARYLRATLLAALVATNRMDLLVLCVPAWLVLAWRVGAGPALRLGAIGWLPLLGWLAFATVYYGTPWPITAYAKAFAGGVSSAELFGQGLYYLGYALRHDPVLALVLAGGIVLGICVPRLRARGLAIGALCYTCYLVRIGGDFMGARLLTPPFVVAFAIWMRWLRAGPPGRARWSGAAAAVLAFLPGLPFWMLPPVADRIERKDDLLEHESGIVDERRYYYPEQGLFGPDRGAIAADCLTTFWPDAPPEHWPCLRGAVGTFAFAAGPRAEVVDYMLCDPLLMRLPMFRPADAPQWRIGHLHRRMPEGYFESVVTRENRILHPGLRAYYGNLAVALRAPLGSGARWHALWGLWTGVFDDGLRAYAATDYANPPLVTVPAAELAVQHPPDAYWTSCRSLRCVYPGGLLVQLPEPRAVTTARLQIYCSADVTVTFVGYDGESAPVTIPAMQDNVLWFRSHDVAVPGGAATIEAVCFKAPLDLALPSGKDRMALIGSVTFD